MFNIFDNLEFFIKQINGNYYKWLMDLERNKEDIKQAEAEQERGDNDEIFIDKE